MGGPIPEVDADKFPAAAAQTFVIITEPIGSSYGVAKMFANMANSDNCQGRIDAGVKDCGCWKGYCWAYCNFGRQWCYTTGSYSQSYNYVTCFKPSECRANWKCAGPCSA
ncbi:Allergen Tha p 2 [Folsomia candida]|uniref:Allergen Tha p 2 n=1 Tax=Folsomia candida TaxID=158441 RepID=A0A226D981_FOLCA|nr:Allergen Tha p 2 [Folsomia candida]